MAYINRPEAATQQMQINNSIVRLVRGDITELDVDTFVFYAQSDLTLGSGFETAISVRGESSIQKELEGQYRTDRRLMI